MTQLIEKPTPPASSEARLGAAPDSASHAAGAVGGPVRLNAFQSLMRRWSKLHPYNAGQVMRISGPADRERWKQAAEAVIGELGLGRPRFSGGVGRCSSEHTVSYVPVEEVVIEQSERDLETFFNEELNRAFAAGDLPVRFCILPGSADAHVSHADGAESHYLAAVYDHWIADSRAMRELMRRVYDRYVHGPDAPSTLAPLTLQTPPFLRLFGRHVGKLKRLAAMRESLKNIWRHRHAYRLNLFDPLDFKSRFLLRELPVGVIEEAHRFAKSRGASVNDLFIALIGQAMSRATAEERLQRSKKPLHFTRKAVGIGTIVDIRDSASEPLEQVFNLYLSSYTVILDNAQQRSTEDLMLAAAGETRRIKRSKGAVKGFWALVMARFWYDVYDSPRFRASLLHKTVPVVAGISNVNMTGGWAEAKAAAGQNGHTGAGVGPRVLDYLRISPTGPLIPLVFTLTTIGGRLSLCVTYRTTAFGSRKINEIVTDFMRRLEEIGAAGGA